jgi:hypothetical protein
MLGLMPKELCKSLILHGSIVDFIVALRSGLTTLCRLYRSLGLQLHSYTPFAFERGSAGSAFAQLGKGDQLCTCMSLHAHANASMHMPAPVAPCISAALHMYCNTSTRIHPFMYKYALLANCWAKATSRSQSSVKQTHIASHAHASLHVFLFLSLSLSLSMSLLICARTAIKWR